MCETFVEKHNLHISANQNPAKENVNASGSAPISKTLLTLCHNVLPWVNKITDYHYKWEGHSGQRCHVEKGGVYKQNNESLRQLHFVILDLWWKLMKFTTRILWDHFGKEKQRIDKSWNLSLRNMVQFLLSSHMFLKEKVSETRHVIFSLYARFISFMDKLKTYKKSLIWNLLRTEKADCRSAMRHNHRKNYAESKKGSPSMTPRRKKPFVLP